MRGLRDVAPVKADAAFAGGETEEGEAERRLAGAAFADHAERLAALHGQRHAVDRLHIAAHAPQEPAADREPHLELVAFDERRRRRVGRHGGALGLGGEEVAGVGVSRVGEDLVAGAALDDLALSHHADPVGEAADDAEIVRDE